MKELARKKFYLDDKTEKLVNKYMERTGQDFEQVMNEAARFYLINKLGIKEARKCMKSKDSDDSKYIDEMLNSNMHNDYM